MGGGILGSVCVFMKRRRELTSFVNNTFIGWTNKQTAKNTKTAMHLSCSDRTEHGKKHGAWLSRQRRRASVETRISYLRRMFIITKSNLKKKKNQKNNITNLYNDNITSHARLVGDMRQVGSQDVPARTPSRHSACTCCCCAWWRADWYPRSTGRARSDLQTWDPTDTVEWQCSPARRMG